MALGSLKMAPHHFLVLVVTVAIYIALLVFSMNKPHTAMTSQHLLDHEPHHVDTKQHKTNVHADPERVKRLPAFHPIVNIHHPKINIAELQRFTKSNVRYVAANDDEESSLSGDSAAAGLDMSSNAVFSRSFADNRPKPRRILPKSRESSKYIYNKHIYVKHGQSTRSNINSNPKHNEVMFKNDEPQSKSYYARIAHVFAADEHIAPQDAVADEESGDQRSRTCKPHTNVVYIKTHKTGSSTLQNIIYRFGDERNLTFALPAHGVYIQSVREFKASSLLPAPQGGQYNILANHVRFFENDIKSIMPADTKFITIVRKSSDQFQSMYTYFTMEKQYKATIEQYSINPEYFYEKFGTGRFTRHSGRDPMLFDLGMGRRDSEDPARVRQHIEFLDKRFDLVLVLEHFYESLILLRELLCWDIESLAHVSNKIRVSFAPPEFAKLSVEDQRAADDVARRLDRWNAGDVSMYNHFNRTLWRRIDAYGRARMEKEVSELKDLCWRYEQECMNGTSVRDISRGSLEHTGLLEYVVKPSQTNNVTCQRLAMIPKFYLSQLREKQIRRYHENRTN